MNISNVFEKIIVNGKEIDLNNQQLITTGSINIGNQGDVIVEYIFKDNTKIPANIFKGLKQLKYAYFSKANNIHTICEEAFADSNLTYIDTLKYIDYIGPKAFSYTKLSYVSNWDAPDSIAANAWSNIDTLDKDFKNKLSYKYPYIDFENDDIIETEFETNENGDVQLINTDNNE